jgi:hypothetical protein
MQIDKAFESGMMMSDATWARHANPWSVYTRIPILPLLAVAIWSRVWIGWWALVPIAVLIAWTFVNPRAFPPPASMDSWASRAVLGERFWLERKRNPIPQHHARWAAGLGVAAALALVPMVWGLWALEPSAALLGAMLAVAFKLWFCDRMVWLCEDMHRGEAQS